MGQYVEYFYEHNKSIPYFAGDKNINRQRSFFYTVLEEFVFSSNSATTFKTIRHLAINDQIGAYFYSKHDFIEDFVVENVSFASEIYQDFSIMLCDIEWFRPDEPVDPPAQNPPDYPIIPEFFCGQQVYAHWINCRVFRECEQTLTLNYYCSGTIVSEDMPTLSQNGFGYDGENLRTQVSVSSNAPDGTTYTIRVKAIINPGPFQTEITFFAQNVVIANNSALLYFALPPNESKIIINNNEYDVTFIATIDGYSDITLPLVQPAVGASYTLIEEKLKTIAEITGLADLDFDNYITKFEHKYTAPSGSKIFDYDINIFTDLKQYKIVDLPIQHDIGGDNWVYECKIFFNIYNNIFRLTSTKTIYVDYELPFLTAEDFQGKIKFTLNSNQIDFDDIILRAQDNGAFIFVADKASIINFTPSPSFFSSFVQSSPLAQSSNYSCSDLLGNPCTNPPSNLSIDMYNVNVQTAVTNYGVKIKYNGQRVAYESQEPIVLDDLVFKVCMYRYWGTPSGVKPAIGFIKKVFNSGKPQETLFIPIAYGLFNYYFLPLAAYEYDRKQLQHIQKSMLTPPGIWYMQAQNGQEIILAFGGEDLALVTVLWPVDNNNIPNSISDYDNLVMTKYNELTNFLQNNYIYFSSYVFNPAGLPSQIRFSHLDFQPLNNQNFSSLIRVPNINILNLAFFLREEVPGGVLSMKNFTFNAKNKGVGAIIDNSDGVTLLDFYVNQLTHTFYNTNEYIVIAIGNTYDGAYITFPYGSQDLFDYANTPYQTVTGYNNNNYQIRPFLVSTDISENLPPNFLPAIEVLGYIDSAEARNRFLNHVQTLVNNNIIFMMEVSMPRPDLGFKLII